MPKRRKNQNLHEFGDYGTFRLFEFGDKGTFSKKRFGDFTIFVKKRFSELLLSDRMFAGFGGTFYVFMPQIVPLFMAIIVGVGDFAYRREEGIYYPDRMLERQI